MYGLATRCITALPTFHLVNWDMPNELRQHPEGQSQRDEVDTRRNSRCSNQETDERENVKNENHIFPFMKMELPLH
jgi:hypothetical protein